MRQQPIFRFGFAAMATAALGASCGGCSCNAPAVSVPAVTIDADPDGDPEVDASDVNPNPIADVDPPPEPQKTTSTQDAESVEVISFDDLIIGMQPDTRFRDIMLEYEGGRVKELFGKQVNVGGYMNPTDTLDGVTEFILLRNLECKFGPGGQADHLVRVLMQEGLTTNFTDKIVYVEGVLELNIFPQDGPSTWSIYDLKATKVSTRPPPRNRR